MGSGKSKKGRKLAVHLGFQFIDMDEWIEQNEKMSIPEIFKTKGEAYFRNAEYNALQKLRALNKTVISTGGGSPCYFNAIDQMNDSGITIYLKGNAEFLKDRLLHSKKKRPLIENLSPVELINFIENKLAERNPFYEKASIHVDALNCKSKELEQLVIPLLNQHK